MSKNDLKMPEEKFGTKLVRGGESHQAVVLGVLIILLALIFGGLYLWSTTLETPELNPPEKIERPSAEENNEPESNNAEADAQAFQALSTSDEIGAIEADIESTNLQNLDAELQAIDAELQANN